nr:hypothetical protein CTI12_AA123990 [Tanacetum cinerariifolium]
MMHNYQDAMALCRTYSNPYLFVTFTSNPKWPEIAEMLAYIPGQKSHDRLEVRTRVFKMKLIGLLEDMTKHHIFGKYCAETVINEDGYPVYRRRDNKITAVKGKFTYDNRHVVPHNRGAQSSTYLKMVNKINYATFKAACFVYDLLNDDKEWTDAIEEVSIWAMAQQLHDLFVTILLFCDVSRPLKLWEENWVRFQRSSTTQSKFANKPGQALFFDANKSKAEHEKLHSMLNPEQRLIYEQMIKSVHNDKGQFCFIHRTGGTGKTFLYKTIIARLRSEQMIVLAVATSALDKTLQDILGYKNQAKRNSIFRRMTVLFGWDFRQILPVIPNAKRPEIVAETHPDFTLRQGDDEYLTERAILTPRNDDADAINENMFKKLGGPSVTYNSADEI